VLHEDLPKRKLEKTGLEPTAHRGPGRAESRDLKSRGRGLGPRFIPDQEEGLGGKIVRGQTKELMYVVRSRITAEAEAVAKRVCQAAWTEYDIESAHDRGELPELLLTERLVRMEIQVASGAVSDR